MGIGDLFKASENQQLKERVSELEALLTPEMMDLNALNRSLADTKQKISERERDLWELEEKKKQLNDELKTAKLKLIETNESVLMQEFGLYTPKYDFVNSDEYKSRLLEIRAQQKDMIKNKTAATGLTGWTVNNSASKGRKMVADMQKLLIRAFNSECDDVNPTPPGPATR